MSVYEEVFGNIHENAEQLVSASSTCDASNSSRQRDKSLAGKQKKEQDLAGSVSVARVSQGNAQHITIKIQPK